MSNPHSRVPSLQMLAAIAYNPEVEHPWWQTTDRLNTYPPYYIFNSSTVNIRDVQLILEKRTPPREDLIVPFPPKENHWQFRVVWNQRWGSIPLVIGSDHNYGGPGTFDVYCGDHYRPMVTRLYAMMVACANHPVVETQWVDCEALWRLSQQGKDIPVADFLQRHRESVPFNVLDWYYTLPTDTDKRAREIMRRRRERNRKARKVNQLRRELDSQNTRIEG